MMTNCPNCGAPLEGRGYCSYCGTVFESSHTPIIATIHQSHVQMLSAQVAVPFEYASCMDSDDISNYAISELTKQLARGLASVMAVDVFDDPAVMRRIVRGKVRVLPSDFRF